MDMDEKVLETMILDANLSLSVRNIVFDENFSPMWRLFVIEYAVYFYFMVLFLYGGCWPQSLICIKLMGKKLLRHSIE